LPERHSTGHVIRENQAWRILSLNSKEAGWVTDTVTEGLDHLNNSSVYYSSYDIW